MTHVHTAGDVGRRIFDDDFALSALVVAAVARPPLRYLSQHLLRELRPIEPEVQERTDRFHAAN